MATAVDIMKGGFSAFGARAINGQNNITVTAAGTSQTDATAVTASTIVVTTAAASTGIRLPACEIGDSMNVLNLGANAVTIYPDSGAQINALGANAGFQLAPNTAAQVRRFSTTRWMAFLSA